MKPSEVTFKGTSISPDPLNGQVAHEAYEGSIPGLQIVFVMLPLQTSLFISNYVTGSMLGACNRR